MASPQAGPELEFGDPVRQALLQEIEIVAKDDSVSDFTVPPDVWAALWLCDLERLQELQRLSPALLCVVLGSRRLPSDVLKQCTWSLSVTPPDSSGLMMLPILGNPRKRLQPRTSSAASSRNSSPGRSVNPQQVAGVIERPESRPTSHPRPKRSELQKKLCKSRDNTRCVITQMPEVVEIAHIYPYSLSSLPEHDSFWNSLQIFWSDERLQQWKAAVYTENKTEVCHNLITLAPHAHACWERALFALKPLDIAEDQKTMRVQFFWLRQYPRRPHQPITTRPELPASLDGDMTNLKLFNCETEEKIHSGTILTLHTDDPVTKPLPSIALLEMQWILHRLTALSGGADIFLPEFDGHDDSSDVDLDPDVSDESSLREGDWRWGNDSDESPDLTYRLKGA
ncbi:hypothetical protein FQN50_003260 [Emmonsiellopsis sp. PD_5]|nr:hypothetical protein FQN50_003260 [Emmonsiellopsis sp. PD_5]